MQSDLNDIKEKVRSNEIEQQMTKHDILQNSMNSILYKTQNQSSDLAKEIKMSDQTNILKNETIKVIKDITNRIIKLPSNIPFNKIEHIYDEMKPLTEYLNMPNERIYENENIIIFNRKLINKINNMIDNLQIGNTKNNDQSGGGIEELKKKN